MVEIEIMGVDVCTLHLFSFDVEARHFGGEGGGEDVDGGERKSEEGEGRADEGMIWGDI